MIGKICWILFTTVYTLLSILHYVIVGFIHIFWDGKPRKWGYYHNNEGRYIIDCMDFRPARIEKDSDMYKEDLTPFHTFIRMVKSEEV